MRRHKAKKKEVRGAQLPPYDDTEETDATKGAGLKYREGRESPEFGGRTQGENVTSS